MCKSCRSNIIDRIVGSILTLISKPLIYGRECDNKEGDLTMNMRSLGFQDIRGGSDIKEGDITTLGCQLDIEIS